MAFANRVMMLFNSAVFLQIAGVAANPGGGSGTGGGTSPLGRQPVGIPESIPDTTFIANPLPGDNGFIASANEFHNTFSLSPIGINSIEDILVRLQTAPTPIRCMRIVTHADFNNLFIWLFNNGSRGVLAGPLAGFARSDTEGLVALLTAYLSSGTVVSSFLFQDHANQALNHLRTSNAAVLRPFGLDQPADTLNADQRTLFRRHLDLLYLDHATITWDHSNEALPGSTAPPDSVATAAELDVVRASIRTILTDFQSRFVGLPIRNTTATTTLQQVQDLRTALSGLTLGNIGLASVRMTIDGQLLLDLRAANRVIAAGLRAKINHARTRFTRNSRIDIRGCRIAQGSHVNLQAIQAFFGPPGDLPMVTGPNWLQSFPARVRTMVPPEIDNFIAAGDPGQNITTADINQAFTEWRDLVRFHPFFQFILALHQGTPFDYTRLSWRQLQTTAGGPGIPLLNLPAERVEDLPTLNLTNLIQRFRTVFDINTAHPNTAERTRLGSLQPHVATFAGHQQRISAATSPTAAELTQFFNDLKTVYNAIIGVSGITAPNPRLIPATAPTPLDLSTLQVYLTAIRTFIDTTLRTNYGSFFTDVTTAMQAANGELKAYLAFGLPLLIQSSSNPANHLIICNNALRTSAMRNFLRLLWTGDTSQVATMTTRISSLTFPWDNTTELGRRLRIPAVHEEHASTDPSAFAPTVAYNIHIVVEPPTP